MHEDGAISSALQVGHGNLHGGIVALVDIVKLHIVALQAHIAQVDGEFITEVSNFRHHISLYGHIHGLV